MTRDDIHTCHAECQRPACVAVREREKVAQWMIERGYATGHGDTIEGLLGELDWQAREREKGLTKLNKAAEDNGEPL